MISKTIGFRGVPYFQTHPYSQNSGQERRGQGATIASQLRDFVGDSKIDLHVSA